MTKKQQIRPTEPPNTPFPDADALDKWLNEHGINTETWGMGSAKSVHNLWREIETSDCVLTPETPPRRFIQVVYLVIQQGDHILIEAEQTLRDGRVRRRGRPPAEKIQGVESAESAALRCLHEELRITGSDFKIVRRANGSIHEISESPSYPGLLTLYAMHIVDVYGLELPTHNFVRVELQTSAENAVKRHEWAWRLPNSDDLIRFAPTNSEVFALNP